MQCVWMGFVLFPDRALNTRMVQHGIAFVSHRFASTQVLNILRQSLRPGTGGLVVAPCVGICPAAPQAVWPATMWVWTRVTHDAVGLAAHVATMGILGGAASAGYIGSTTGRLVLAQEAVAAVAHVWYVLLHYRHYGAMFGQRPPGYTPPAWFYPINQVKWLEYAASATLGTVATLYTAPIPAYVVAFVTLAAVAQQAVGYQIDRPAAAAVAAGAWVAFASAVLLQVGEFMVVGAVVESPYVVATYTTMWSSFGVHAGLRLYARATGSWETRWLSDDWSEAIYSCLSWTAKIAVVAATWADADAPGDQGVVAAVVATAVGVVLWMTAAQTDAPSPYTNLGNLYV